ncbi:carboxymuconolactone decarboxylase family protein [Portibacter lacus]|uniref:Carboxymuconolactone decarboxylase family protein n=1 Tax=Portibacter lacus TaxID=1099794 RepID=A0AA37SMA7_9BACT|nr:hypothetical protein [Portibacter lacus]GLR17303.1 hypothetical protein GCM10007940_19180 [Portibacter lacus]
MTTLKVHTIDTAPEGSKSQLKESAKSFGRIPNLHGVLAGAPGTLEAYKKLGDLFLESSLTAEEQTVVWQTINVENECHYCVPAHTAIAGMMKIDPALTEALRNSEPMPTPKLQALQDATLSLVRNRGHLTDSELNAFYNAGYGERQLLDIILGIAQKTISNYTNHIANTPVDKAFAKFEWKKEVVAV